MATTIQILVAGSLLLAWIWVLGRPLVGGGTVRRSDYRDLDRSFVARPDAEVGPPRQVQALIAWWGRWQPEARRRQLMLATMFAVIASFLLAIALRGMFVTMFLLMVGVFAVHVAIASYYGARIIEDRRAMFVAEVKRTVRLETGTISIKAPRVGPDQPEVVSSDVVLDDGAREVVTETTQPTLPVQFDNEVEVAAEVEVEAESGTDDPVERVAPAEPPASGDTAELLDELFAPSSSRPVVRRPEPSSFDVAHGMASALESGSDDGQPVGVTSFVSALIESEWGDDEQLAAPRGAAGAETESATEPEAESETALGAGPEEAETADASTTTDDEPAVVETPEPIFTRAAKDEPARSRRRARPIYIEDQLEDDDDDTEAVFPTAKAVNHP